jgi:hypothetical protein
VLQPSRDSEDEGELLVERIEGRLRVPSSLRSAHARYRRQAEPCIVIVSEPSMARRHFLACVCQSLAEGRRDSLAGAHVLGRAAETRRRDLLGLDGGRHDGALGVCSRRASSAMHIYPGWSTPTSASSAIRESVLFVAPSLTRRSPLFGPSTAYIHEEITAPDASKNMVWYTRGRRGGRRRAQLLHCIMCGPAPGCFRKFVPHLS